MRVFSNWAAEASSRKNSTYLSHIDLTSCEATPPTFGVALTGDAPLVSNVSGLNAKRLDRHFEIHVTVEDGEQVEQD
jgi:hypothetical protein